MRFAYESYYDSSLDRTFLFWHQVYTNNFSNDPARTRIMRAIELNPFAPVARMLARNAEAARRTRDLKRLRALPDHLLRDIGLVRGRF